MVFNKFVAIVTGQPIGGSVQHPYSLWWLISLLLWLQVSQLEGVYSIHEPHFWTLCTDVYVGAVKVEVAHDADSKYILSQTHNIFTAVSIVLS